MQICKTIHAYTPANKSSARIPQPAGYFSSSRIGQDLDISNSRNSAKPIKAVIKICRPVACPIAKNGLNKNGTAWPANSSATTSRGSFLPVAAMAAEANCTQTKPPAKTKTAITFVIIAGDAPNKLIRPKIITGGSEPHVPGAKGSQPRPKQDVSILFIFTIIAEG